MSKKKLVKRVAGIALTVGVVILAVVCVGKVNRIQNEKILLAHGRMQMLRRYLPFKRMGNLL